MRRKLLLRIHRWLGLSATAFLILLSITGILLNYTEFLKLDSTYVRNGFILKLYGMSPSNEATLYESKASKIAYIEESLFFNGKFIAKTSQPVAPLKSEKFHILLTENEIHLISLENELIESIKQKSLPYDQLTAVLTTLSETASPSYILISENGNFKADPYWITFDSYEESIQTEAAERLSPTKSDPAYVQSLMQSFQGNGIPLYRVLLDLHSGKLFSVAGQTIMNLTALSILVLITSGLMSWKKRKRRICENFDRCKENAS